MKLEALNQLFKETHPNGYVQYDRQARKYFVVFSSPGKVYTYHASSNYKLAERLELISDVDIVAVARDVIAALGRGEEIVTHIGASDTVRYMGVDCTSIPTGVDEYDRPLALYRRPTESELAWG
jgi:hypothetical protein